MEICTLISALVSNPMVTMQSMIHDMWKYDVIMSAFGKNQRHNAVNDSRYVEK